MDTMSDEREGERGRGIQSEMEEIESERETEREI